MIPKIPEINLGTPLSLVTYAGPNPLAVTVNVDGVRRVVLATHGEFAHHWDIDDIRQSVADGIGVRDGMRITGFARLRAAIDRLDELEAAATELATPTQRDRMAESLESREVELMTIVRYELFRPFTEFRKRVRLRSAALAHTEECASPQPEITWSTSRPPTLVGAETFRQMTTAAETAAKHPWLTTLTDQALRAYKIRLEQRYHHGVCNTCGAEVGQHAVLVTIPWAGRALTREYVPVLRDHNPAGSRR